MVIPVIATWEAEGIGPLEAQKPVRISCPMKAQARDPASNTGKLLRSGHLRKLPSDLRMYMCMHANKVFLMLWGWCSAL